MGFLRKIEFTATISTDLIEGSERDDFVELGVTISYNDQSLEIEDFRVEDLETNSDISENFNKEQVESIYADWCENQDI